MVKLNHEMHMMRAEGEHVMTARNVSIVVFFSFNK